MNANEVMESEAFTSDAAFMSDASVATNGDESDMFMLGDMDPADFASTTSSCTNQSSGAIPLIAVFQDATTHASTATTNASAVGGTEMPIWSADHASGGSRKRKWYLYRACADASL